MNRKKLLGIFMPCCGVGKVAGCCAHGNEHWVSVKWGGGGISWLSEELLHYQERLCSIELVSQYGVVISPPYSTVSNKEYCERSLIFLITAALLAWLAEWFYYWPFGSVAAMVFIILWKALSKKVEALYKFLRLCFRVTEVNRPSDWSKHQRRG